MVAGPVVIFSCFMLDLECLRSRRIGLALSGGSVRGIAHIGVIKVLGELGIQPHVIAGTSAGSLVGAGLAAGMHWSELKRLAREVYWPRLLNGSQLEEFCRRHLPHDFSDLDRPFCAVATILPSKQPLMIKRGALASALSASCAMRFVRRPVARNGKRLKDGGIACVLPALACREMGAEYVISSDVWEISSLLRSMGWEPEHPRFGRLFPSHYLKALQLTDLLILPSIPVAGYMPGRSSIERLIRRGEVAAWRSLESDFGRMVRAG